ncbi:MAG TPA: proton-conducting transporter membrane subunit, partial [bacterium]|nr:proton-conducting transporter membrane subunit [bacterium]
LYTATGTLNMTDLAARLSESVSSRTVITGILFIFLGLAIKMGLFPFHGWLPDAYTYASDSATALIAPLMTKTAIYAFVRIFIIVLGYPLIHQLGVPKLLMALGAIAVMAGSIMAFIQPQFKRMLAYSSISHIGLIVLALGMNHPAAFVGAILHILNHAVMKASLFLTAAAAYERRAVRDILDFGKLRGFMPLTLAGFAVAALSMAGVPPFCGFFSKWYILVGAVQSGHPVMAGVIVFSSLLTALYFFKVIEKAFFQKGDGPKPVIAEAPVPLLLSGVFLSALILILGLVSPLLFSWGMRALVAGVT